MLLPLKPAMSSSENLARREPISRVTSFKRDWEGSDELKQTARKLGAAPSGGGEMGADRALKRARARSDVEIEWTPTPPEQRCVRLRGGSCAVGGMGADHERWGHRNARPPPVLPAAPTADTAAARRRAAMLAALAQPGAMVGPGPSSMAAKREIGNAPWAADSLK